ncbi:flagellar protein FliT [Terrilactibacillus sp. BCM23-1]|uniref:Flagellar protein FliT n=1 Tax=Terrilactibacillus tamarindi TaxID=2599694 RepID=A0A6N8CN78_9BACI|nr:flagellar protein FliT [Terrilactibacillus tamarindi]MTT31574.1 flagellar protein FliT [Terrilactibacillus tamarindi]
MDAVEKIYELTMALQQSISEYHKEARDETIEQIQSLLAERGEWMKKLPPSYSTEQKALGKKIVELNQVIDPGLKSICNDIRNDLIMLKRKRKTSHRYRNPYQGPPVDGMFLDKKE